MRWSTVARCGVLFIVSAASVLHSAAVSPVPGAARPAPPAAETAGESYLRLHLASAPFPDSGRASGFQYGDSYYPADPHYVDSSVAVFVPPGYHGDGPTNLVFFFHGWFSSIDDARQRFDLPRQFSQSGAQALLVIPELAWNAPDSFGGKLEERGGFARLVDELLARLAARGVISGTSLGSIVLAGHSGAFEVMARILRNGDLATHIRQVLVFDGLYAYTNQFRRWIEQGYGSFVSVMAADGEETTDVDSLIGLLRDDGADFRVAPDDPDQDPETLQARVLFLRSASDHYGVISDRDEFRRILGASPAVPHRVPA